MITYNDLYEYSRKERYSKELQKLPKIFIKELSDYLKEKKIISSKEEGNFSDVVIKTKKQLENANTLFKELFLRRRKKILDLVLIANETGISRKDFENMLDFEKELFENLMKCIEKTENFIDNSLNGVNSNNEKNEMIIINEDISELVGINNEKIGPFFKGQIVNISKEIADILINGNKAEIFDEEN
jgi:DNA replication initiation complex subunit (GINS family)